MTGSLTSFFKYLTVSPRDEAWQIYCTDAGYTGIPPGIPYPPRAADHPPEYSRNWERGRILHEYQLIYITRGKGLFKTEKEKQFTITEGTAFMLFPGYGIGTPRTCVPAGTSIGSGSTALTRASW